MVNVYISQPGEVFLGAVFYIYEGQIFVFSTFSSYREF